VLEQSENENRALNLGKRKMGNYRRGFKGENYKHYRPSCPQRKGKQPTVKKNRPLYSICGRHHDGPSNLGNIRCYGCEELGHKINDCPKDTWNQPRMQPAADQRRLLNSAPQGRLSTPGASQQPRNSRKRQVGGRVYCIEAGIRGR